jgi:hypothetical protein
MQGMKWTVAGVVGTFVLAVVCLMWIAPADAATCGNSSVCSKGCHGKASLCSDMQHADCLQKTESCMACNCKDADPGMAIFCNCTA